MGSYPNLTSKLSFKAEKDQHPVFKKVVLTGGPCGGKTTMLLILKEIFESHGWVAIISPEVSTIIRSSGILQNGMDEDDVQIHNKHIFTTMKALQDGYFQMAENWARKHNKKYIIFCDRGLMDPSCYQERAEWLAFLESERLTETDIRENRYDIVLHLQTCARGAVDFYTSSKIRQESVELARQLDIRVQEAWMLHPNFATFSNDFSFEEKRQRIINHVFKCTGMSNFASDDYFTKKEQYLLKSFNIQKVRRNENVTNIHFFDYETLVLHSAGNEEIKIVRRATASNIVYILIKKEIIHGKENDNREIISEQEFLLFRNSFEKRPRRVLKTRCMFFYRDVHFKIDQIHRREGEESLYLLICYRGNEEKKRRAQPEIPDGIVVEVDVSADPLYSDNELSQEEEG